MIFSGIMTATAMVRNFLKQVCHDHIRSCRCLSQTLRDIKAAKKLLSSQLVSTFLCNEANQIKFICENPAWWNVFFVHPVEKIINFLFFRKSHERSLNSQNQSFLSEHCTIREVIGMATMIYHLSYCYCSNYWVGIYVWL